MSKIKKHTDVPSSMLGQQILNCTITESAEKADPHKNGVKDTTEVSK